MRLVKLLFLTAFFLFHETVYCQPATDQQLAVHYYQAGDFEKAAMYYEKLYDKQKSDFYYNYYLRCLIELKDYKEAEKLIRKQQKRNSGNVGYYVDLGEVYKAQGDENKARKEYDNAIKELDGRNFQMVVTLGATFRDKKEYDLALAVYEKGEKFSGQPSGFRQYKAEIYGLKGDYAGMYGEYLAMLDDNAGNINYVQNLLSQMVDFSQPDHERVEVLRQEILKRIQKNPNNDSYNDLLIWFFQQKGDFIAAFNQVRALDKRNKENGYRMYEFGLTCKSNENYDLAVKAFEYIITEKGANGEHYYNAKIELADVLFKKIVSRGIYEETDLKLLETIYEETLAETGKNSSTAHAMRSLARLRAFYLHDIDGAVELLNELLVMPGVNQVLEAEIKMELGDALMIRGDIWDASLYYSQVEKAYKHDPIGHEAKFRNAKISFYTGDFSWAQAQLNVLKTSTSKLISNDAMHLSLLITDNMGMDSVPDAMKLYAEADLLVFQNKFDEAETKLDSLTKKFPWHSLQDEMYFLRYQIAMKERNYEKAMKHLTTIIELHGRDILGDDAVFKAAELEHYYFKNEEKATELYKKLLFDYPGSLYIVEARKRYRTLTGDEPPGPKIEN